VDQFPRDNTTMPAEYSYGTYSLAVQGGEAK